MKKLNLKIVTLTSIGVLSLCLQPSLAASISEWKPNLSEKILLLPPQHLEQAIDQDFSKSLLAQDLIDVDTQLNQQVGQIQKLQEVLIFIILIPKIWSLLTILMKME